MALKAAMWAHGTIVQVEFPERLVANGLIQKGWGAHIQGLPGTTNWFHFPITTPVILDDVRSALGKVFVLYATVGPARITDVHVYDGPKRVKAIDGLYLSGDHSVGIDASNSWAIDPPITIFLGLGISVGVEFGLARIPPAPEILFTAAGADLVVPTTAPIPGP